VASQAEQVVLEDGRRFEVSRYDDLRMRGWPEQRVSLYPGFLNGRNREAPSHGISGVTTTTYAFEEELFSADTV
jgi:hypothetical protein